MNQRKNGLTPGARFALFVVSYLPMFAIMVFRQLYTYRNHLHFGGFNAVALGSFVKYFGMATLITIISIVGVVGLCFLLKNMKRRTTQNGEPITVVDIENKNSETMTYLFTYVIPFVFQDLSDLKSVVPICVLLLVTYRIYRNSTLILINPTISMWYSLYQVEYLDDGADAPRKKGMLITRDAFLEEMDKVKVKKIGHKLFYAQTMEGEEGNE